MDLSANKNPVGSANSGHSLLSIRDILYRISLLDMPPYTKLLAALFFPERRKRGRQLIIIGLGAWLFVSNPQDLWKEWNEAHRAGADGVAFFSYDQMVGKGDLWTFPPTKTP